MTYIEVNELLRVMARKVISMGFKKTNIGRTVFGASSYPMFLRFINEEEKDFGIKPLERAADVINYETRLVFIDPNDEDSEDLIEQIEDRNREFVLGLEDYIRDNLGSSNGESKGIRKSSLDSAIDRLLGVEPSMDIDLED